MDRVCCLSVQPLQVRSHTCVACVRKRSASRRISSHTDVVTARSSRTVDTRCSVAVTSAPADHVTTHHIHLSTWCHRRRWLSGFHTLLCTPTPFDQYYFRSGSMTSLLPLRSRCRSGVWEIASTSQWHQRDWHNLYQKTLNDRLRYRLSAHRQTSP